MVSSAEHDERRLAGGVVMQVSVAAGCRGVGGVGNVVWDLGF